MPESKSAGNEKSRALHMSSEEFRRQGKALIDWIADYHEHIEQYPVLSPVTPGEIYGGLPEHPPEHGEPFAAMLADVETKVMPGITHWQSPNFYAYFPSNGSPVSILGELLSAGLGVQGMIWATSPACTEVEMRVLDWLVEMLALPKTFLSAGPGGGVIQDTASSSTLTALLAARERATGFASNEDGVEAKLACYTSAHAHSSIEKAVKIAGLGRKNLRLIPVDEKFAMRPEALEEAITRDRKAGFIPAFVCAAAGTTSSLAFDPIASLGAICKANNLWLHVDAAMAGTAALCPEFRWIQQGLELADSYTFNPHKWMFTSFDCNCFWVADRKALIATLSILPEFLRNAATASGAVIDYRDWHIQLGRRFRALKLWFVIRHYGVQGLRQLVREHVRLAQAFAGWIRSDPRFELMAPADLNLVCFRLRGEDAPNEVLLARLNATGKLYLSHTKLNGRYTLRMSIGQTRTEERHVRAAWDIIRTVAGP